MIYNDFLVYDNNKKNIKIFIRKNGNKVIKEFLPVLGVKKSDLLAQLASSNIKNIQVHLNNRGSLDYYSLYLVDPSIQLDDKKNLYTCFYKLNKIAVVRWYYYLTKQDEEFKKNTNFEIIFGKFIDKIHENKRFINRLGILGNVATSGELVQG